MLLRQRITWTNLAAVLTSDANSTTESVRNTSRIAFNATAFNMSSVIDLAMQVWQRESASSSFWHEWNTIETAWNLCEHPKVTPQKKTDEHWLSIDSVDCWRKISSHDYSHFYQDEWACGSGRQRLIYIYTYIYIITGTPKHPLQDGLVKQSLPKSTVLGSSNWTTIKKILI